MQRSAVLRQRCVLLPVFCKPCAMQRPFSVKYLLAAFKMAQTCCAQVLPLCTAHALQHHAGRRVDMAYNRHLRQYPDISIDPVVAQAEHFRQIRETAREVDVQCGGLLHLELAENLVSRG